MFKYWLWNNCIFKLSKDGRNFKKSLNILHTFTEKVSQFLLRQPKYLLNKHFKIYLNFSL